MILCSPYNDRSEPGPGSIQGNNGYRLERTGFRFLFCVRVGFVGMGPLLCSPSLSMAAKPDPTRQEGDTFFRSRLRVPFQAICCAITTGPCLTKRCDLGERGAEGGERGQQIALRSPLPAPRTRRASKLHCTRDALNRTRRLGFAWLYFLGGSFIVLVMPRCGRRRSAAAEHSEKTWRRRG